MISIICPYNNEEVLKMLIKSLKIQDYMDYELILVNAKEKGFESAAESLNYGASISKGDILVFTHQDIELLDKSILSKIVEYCNANDFGIAGVAGKKADEKYCMTSVLVGKNRKPGGKYITTCICETQTLDECFFIIKKDEFKGFTDYGKTWHFYAVDYSLQSLNNGKKVLLFPLDIYHLSPGFSLNYNYYDTLKKVGKNYKNIRVIATTCGTFKNNAFLGFKCFYYKIKLFLKILLKVKNDKE